jgi:DNA-binding beta-propeller fold protein YncE
LFVANHGSDNVSVFAIGSDGSLSVVQGSPFATGTGPIFLAVDVSGNHLYVADHGSNDIAEFAISSGGALSAISGSPIAVQTSPAWIAVE